jgi:hypothetical protein
MTCRLLLAVLLPLTVAAATPAHADLFIQNLYISTSAEVDTIPHVGVSSSGPDVPTWLTATAETSSQRAFAMQSKNGFFQDFSSSISGVDNVRNTATSHFYLEVGTDTPDTPLVLDFNFLGGQAVGTAYYGAGDMRISLDQAIRAGFGTLDPLFPPLGVDPVWGFGYTVALNDPGAPDWSRITQFEEDTQGIGLPVATDTHLLYPPGTFTTSYSLVLSPFQGTLDFGLLQPGQTFFLDYLAGAETMGMLTYPGTQAAAVASLVDPFSLGSDPPPQLSLRGLTLPPIQIAQGAPEPNAWALLVTGLLPLCGVVLRHRKE